MQIFYVDLAYKIGNTCKTRDDYRFLSFFGKNEKNMSNDFTC